MGPMIDANNSLFSAALDRGDAVAAAATYDEKAILLPPTGEVITGRKAIAGFWRSGIEVGARRVQLEPFERQNAGCVSYEVGRYLMGPAPKAEAVMVENGVYLIVHRQSAAGPWRRVVDMFNSAARE